jgi:hypothetical protein
VKLTFATLCITLLLVGYSRSQTLERFTPLWSQIQSDADEKPVYFTSCIAFGNDEKLFWPVADYLGTTLYKVTPLQTSFSVEYIRRFDEQTTSVVPLINTIQVLDSNIYIGGGENHLLHSFIAGLNFNAKDTNWFRSPLSKVTSIAADNSGVYGCGGGELFFRYDQEGNLQWLHTTKNDSFYVEAQTLIVDESYLYIGGRKRSSNSTVIEERACILKYSKPDGIFVDSFFLDSHPDAIGSRNITQIIRKAGTLYIIGNYEKPGDTSIFAAKLNKDFEIEWYRTWSHGSDAQANTCALDSSGNFWIAGKISLKPYRALLLYYSPDGELMYNGTWDIEEYSEIATLACYQNNVFAAGGKTATPPSAIQTMAFLFMVDIPQLHLTVESKAASQTRAIFVTSTSIKLKVIQDRVGTDYSIIDILGRTVRSGVLNGEETYVQRSGLPNGVYLLLMNERTTTFLLD